MTSTCRAVGDYGSSGISGSGSRNLLLAPVIRPPQDGRASWTTRGPQTRQPDSRKKQQSSANSLDYLSATYDTQSQTHTDTKDNIRVQQSITQRSTTPAFITTCQQRKISVRRVILEEDVTQHQTERFYFLPHPTAHPPDTLDIIVGLFSFSS